MNKIELYKELLEIINKKLENATKNNQVFRFDQNSPAAAYLNDKEKIKEDELIQYLLDVILDQERKQKIKILRYLNLENINFKDQNIEGIDFRCTNAKINPQEIKDKSLKNCILYGLFDGKSFDDVLVTGTDFTSARLVNLDPQKVKYKTLGNAKLGEIDFKGKSFDDVYVFGADFTDAKNINLNPQTVNNKTLAYTNLCGIDFEEKSFDGVYIAGADFTGTLNVKINPQKLLFKSLENINATGVDFGNYSFKGVKVEGALLENSKNCTYKESTNEKEYYRTLIKKIK